LLLASPGLTEIVTAWDSEGQVVPAEEPDWLSDALRQLAGAPAWTRRRPSMRGRSAPAYAVAYAVEQRSSLRQRARRRARVTARRRRAISLLASDDRPAGVTDSQSAVSGVIPVGFPQ